MVAPMKLWYAPTSPFARKARIAIHELGLADEIELVETDPWTDPRLRELNPLAKVPTLELDDGAALYESSVICDYLDAIAGPRRLFPRGGEERWQTLLLQSLADGACMAAARLYADEQRPETERSEAMMDRFRVALDTALAELEATGLAVGAPTIGEIAVAALLGYLDFRWPHLDWRTDNPHLADWFGVFAVRPSMTSTAHRTA